MSDKWTNFLLAVVTVIMIPSLIVNSVFGDTQGFMDHTNIRYFTYLLFIIISIILTIKMYVRQKRCAPWENRDGNLLFGIFISVMLYAVMVTSSAPGLDEITNRDGEVIGHEWQYDADRQSYFNFMKLLMIVYVYAYYWELDRLKTQKFENDTYIQQREKLKK